MFSVAVFAGSVAYAQQQSVADQDVALVALIDSMDVLDVSESNQVDAVEAVAPEGVVDDLHVAVLDESQTTTVDNLISVRLNRVDLEEVINLFAQLSDANIIVPELTEAAKVSVNLKDVEWRPALQAILAAYNYELYQRVSGSSVYSVRRHLAGAPEPQIVETFKLQYATVPNVAALIRDLLPANAKISEFASRNMLVIRSSESSLNEVRAILESIDIVRQQVYIESKFMELTDDAQKDLGFNWGVLESYGASVSLSSAAYGREDFDGTPSENLFQDLTGGSASAVGSGEYSILTSVLNADEFAMTLSALEQNKGVKIVSNPKIIVANEELANISIIRREPNLKQEREQQFNDQPATTTYTLDTALPFFEYGITLDVTPSINTSSNITVKIHPSLTRKFEDKIAGDTTYPVIDEKSIETVFSLSSGQTAAIGGLTEITEGEEEKKVPLLGSIPFIGRLFSWKQTVSGQTETIIFVTVGLANTEQLQKGVDMPGDAELARRQLILDANKRIIRDHGRNYFEAEEQDKLDARLKVLDRQEEDRIQRREDLLEKEEAYKMKWQ